MKVLTPEDVQIRISSLDYHDILTLLPEMSDRQQSILNKAFTIVKKRTRGEARWDVNDLIYAVFEADRTQDDERERKRQAPLPRPWSGN